MILAILQARMSSTRLSGKVLKPIMGRPMIELQIERIHRCRRIDRLIVATSTNSEDKAIIELCSKLCVESYCGSLENVLDRFYQAARGYRPDHIVRLTGDCPLTDPQVIDTLISFYIKQKCDYASNCHPPTLPDGLDAEVFTFSALEQAWKEAIDPREIEHVTPFITNRPNRFKIVNFEYQKDISDLRWTVDEPEDFELVIQIYEALYPVKPEFTFRDILRHLEIHPELMDINRFHKRNIKTLRD